MIKKPDRAKKFQPKCILTDRQISFTATGFVIPCCWVDNPDSRKDKNIKKFFDSKQHIDKHNSVMEIMNGEVFTNFWNMLKNEPEKAPDTCKKYCGCDLSDKVTKQDNYFNRPVVNRKKI